VKRTFVKSFSCVGARVGSCESLILYKCQQVIFRICPLLQLLVSINTSHLCGHEKYSDLDSDRVVILNMNHWVEWGVRGVGGSGNVPLSAR